MPTIRSLVACLFIVGITTHVKCSEFKLTILHTNDIHSHIEQFNNKGEECKDDNSCYGGAARLYTAANEIRKNVTNAILLDAGDQFSGTKWYRFYKGQAAAVFMNESKYDAMALGNHEFDDGPTSLVSFIQSASFPVLSANLDASKEPNWPKETKYNLKSTILERSGRKIGIIGYTTEDTKWLSQPGKNLVFNNVSDALRTEVTKLKAEGVNIIIAVGHAGLNKDRMYAKNVDGLDVIVGGHTHSFLYTGRPPTSKIPEDVYPVISDSPDGTKTLIVQDFEFGWYLGRLDVTFADDGKILSWSGNPVLLDNQFKQDERILNIVKEMAKPMEDETFIKLGKTAVYLEGDRKYCRQQECNLGNLISDTIVRMNQEYKDGNEWTNVALGIWNGGGIRASIDKNSSEWITVSDVKTVLPFGNTADIVEVDGSTLKRAFEHSVSALPDELEGRFLQVSGFRVKYNLKKAVGERLVELKALCIKCRIPSYKLVSDNEFYRVVVNKYMLGGGDGYDMFTDVRNQTSGKTASSYLIDYIKESNRPLIVPLEDRIVFVDKESGTCASSDSKTLTASLLSTVFCLLLVLPWYFGF